MWRGDADVGGATDVFVGQQRNDGRLDQHLFGRSHLSFELRQNRDFDWQTFRSATCQGTADLVGITGQSALRRAAEFVLIGRRHNLEP